MRICENGIYRDATPEELQAFETALAEQLAAESTRDLTADEVVQIVMANVLKTAQDVPEETALRMVSYYPEWQTGTAYSVNDRVQHKETLYSCLQNHTAQANWAPTDAPSLWAKVLIPNANVTPEWEQPDSTNPYAKGDKVTHNGKTWESTLNGNVWEPSIYGWKEVQ